jgi:hypothetical protein
MLASTANHDLNLCRTTLKVFDGIWTFLVALPYMLTLAFAIGKYRGYVDVLRLLAPRRYAATNAKALAAMQLRGLPIDEWILASRTVRVFRQKFKPEECH